MQSVQTSANTEAHQQRKAKNEEEEKLSKMTGEEKDAYFKIHKLQRILKNVRPYFRS